MKHLPAEAWRRAADRAGFVLPMTIVVLVILAAMGVTMISMSRDETLAARAMRESSVALYAAEAGMHQVYAGWDSLAVGVDTLAPGDSLDLGWQTLSTGASYRAVIQRLDNEGGGQAMYALLVDGRGPGVLGGQRRLSYALTSAPGDPGTGYKLGECCEAPVVLKGTFRQNGRDGGNLFHSGFDTHPPGWEAAGACADTLIDKPGIIMRDTTGIVLDPADAVIEGVPPIVQDPTISDSIFDYFGEHTWQDIKDKADIIVDSTGWVYMADGSNPHRVDTSLPDVGLEATEVHPRYTVDPLTDELLCDTSHPLNWGSDDPDDPCFNYFPVILSRGEVDL
ncbi:MAG: pilus assembly PilX N-terminal domain-containing protein, partial [Gemmatimonadota bacterium]